MLSGLNIQNVVLIDQLSIEFGSGFCALTGETGAGKSILLDSLGLVLGARSDAGLVRKGEERAIVTGSFDVAPNHDVHAFLDDQGITAEEPLILRRIVHADGRSRAFVNDQPVSVGLLKQIGDMLVEVHGQFETQGLLDPKTHRILLDQYAGVSSTDIATCWQSWKTAQIALDEAKSAMAQAQSDEDYLRQAIEDLDRLAPQTGEEEKLSGQRERLMHRDQVIQALREGHDVLTSETGAESMTGQACRILERVADKAGEQVQGALEALDRASSEIQEAISLLQSGSADMEHSEFTLEEIDDRLFALRGQARKHGCEIDELSAIRDDLAKRLRLIEHQDEALADLMRAVDKARKAYIEKAEAVSAQRQSFAQKLDELVAKELPPLKLEKAKFFTEVVRHDDEQSWNAHGMDSVRFLVSTNPGRAPEPLNKIASGGEMSRFMLAIKVVMAETGMALSLVFDEVDSGIGGSTAAAVGERLARLAGSRQILVVTHAPQVAARADHHYIVMKDGTDDVTTTIIALSALDQRREEIARMLAGADITSEARAAAEKLLSTGT